MFIDPRYFGESDVHVYFNLCLYMCSYLKAAWTMNTGYSGYMQLSEPIQTTKQQKKVVLAMHKPTTLMLLPTANVNANSIVNVLQPCLGRLSMSTIA